MNRIPNNNPWQQFPDERGQKLQAIYDKLVDLIASITEYDPLLDKWITKIPKGEDE